MGLKASLKLVREYQVAAESKTVEYIETKEELYLDEVDLDKDVLMQLVLNKYSTSKIESAMGITIC